MLIFPAENRRYAADCLELNTTTNPTPIEAARKITGLINDHILTNRKINTINLQNYYKYTALWKL